MYLDKLLVKIVRFRLNQVRKLFRDLSVLHDNNPDRASACRVTVSRLEIYGREIQ